MSLGDSSTGDPFFNDICPNANRRAASFYRGDFGQSGAFASPDFLTGEQVVSQAG